MIFFNFLFLIEISEWVLIIREKVNMIFFLWILFFVVNGIVFENGIVEILYGWI